MSRIHQTRRHVGGSLVNAVTLNQFPINSIWMPPRGICSRKYCNGNIDGGRARGVVFTLVSNGNGENKKPVTKQLPRFIFALEGRNLFFGSDVVNRSFLYLSGAVRNNIFPLWLRARLRRPMLPRATMSAWNRNEKTNYKRIRDVQGNGYGSRVYR